MFISDTTIHTARPIGVCDLDTLGGELISVADLMQEWQRHLFEDDQSTDI